MSGESDTRPTASEESATSRPFEIFVADENPQQYYRFKELSDRIDARLLFFFDGEAVVRHVTRRDRDYDAIVIGASVAPLAGRTIARRIHPRILGRTPVLLFDGEVPSNTSSASVSIPDSVFRTLVPDADDTAVVAVLREALARRARYRESLETRPHDRPAPFGHGQTSSVLRSSSRLPFRSKPYLPRPAKRFVGPMVGSPNEVSCSTGQHDAWRSASCLPASAHSGSTGT